MRHHPKFRFLCVTFIVFIIGTVLFAGHGSTQDSPQQRPVWDVQLARNDQASSNITIQNQCQRPHTFTVTSQQTPFLQFLAAPTVNVPGNSSYNLPVQFNTNALNAGQYQGSVLVKCQTCRNEKTCRQDKETLLVRLTVLQDAGQQNVGPQPGIPRPPPEAIPIATPTPTPSPTLVSAPPSPISSPSPSPSPCGPTPPRSTYTVMDLGELPHPLSSFPSHCIATGVNEAGNVVGACQSKYAGGPPSGSWHAFRTDPFVVIKPKNDLGFPVGVGGGASFAMAVNASGHAVGYWAGGSGEQKAFWHDGFMMINLHPPTSSFTVSEAYALNKEDDVVGSAWSIFTDKHAVIWTHGDHAMIDLNASMDPSAKKDWKLIQAYGINDDGHIVGRGGYLKKLHAFRLKSKDAAPEDLGEVHKISEVDDASVGYGLNACDDVVGYTLDTTLFWHGFLWQDGSGMTTIGTVPGYSYSYGQAINTKEEVVGVASSKFHHSAIFEGIGFSVGSDPKGVAYSHAIWYGGEKVKTLKDLNKFIPGFPGWELNLANGINDLGQIAGSGFYKAPGYIGGSLYSKAVLLTPTELVAKLSGPAGSKSPPPESSVEYFTKLKVGAPLAFFVPFPSSIPCCVYVVKSGAPTIEGAVTHKAYYYLLDEKDKPGANPYGTSISFSFDPTYITMPTGFKIPPGPKYGYFLFTTKKVTTPVTTSIKVKVIADKATPGTGGEAETTITFTITPVP